MLVNVKYRREFLSGNLKGCIINDHYRSDAKLAPKVGIVREFKPVCGSGMVRDTIVGIEPYMVVITPRGEEVPL